MAPGALYSARSSVQQLTLSPVPAGTAALTRNCLFSRSAKNPPLRVVKGIGNYYELENGSRVYDASCGAGVCGLGRYDVRVERAIVEQMRLGISYIPSLGFDTDITAALAQFLIASTNGNMGKVVFYGSGMRIFNLKDNTMRSSSDRSMDCLLTDLQAQKRRRRL